jgi:PAS domain S-box-containing protein
VASLSEHALASDRAVVVGNRAGIVEWANPAWTRITGFPLDDTLSKPISHFLDAADIDIDLVDFVGQQFLEGKRCTVEFPFEAAEGGSIWVHLEVDPVRNEFGEITEFVAMATDASDRRARDLDEHRARLASGSLVESGESPASGGPTPGAARGEQVSLSERVELRCRRGFAATQALQLDLALARDLGPIACSPAMLDELIDRLVESAATALASEWGTVTALTGRTAKGSAHVSQAYPFAVRPPALTSGPMRFLELHDTGPSLSLERLRAIREERASTEDRRANALCEASRIARSVGASLHIQSAPGCGTQTLVLFGPIED